MNLPIEIISVIFSYLYFKRCYRCNNIILPYKDEIKSEQYIFCSKECIEYTHY